MKWITTQEIFSVCYVRFKRISASYAKRDFLIFVDLTVM